MKKKHIRKYNKIRKLHGEVVDSMEDYILKGKYDIQKFYDTISSENFNYNKIEDIIYIDLDYDNYDDRTILDELYIYSGTSNCPSIIDIFLDNNKFRNKEKLEMLNCMKNSIVGLFKVIKVDTEEGYVTYEDVFTHNKYKVIDIALSSSFMINKKIELYCYNRIITYEDISFTTGIHCMMTYDNKKLRKFIKNHKYKKNNDIYRCLKLYSISKQDNLQVTFNNQY